jgi:hypothetical protein
LILVDTNVLLDLVTNDPDWSAWSLARLEEAALAGPILINDIVYAETSIRYGRIENLDSMLSQAGIEIAPPAARAAGFCPISSSAPMPPSKAGPRTAATSNRGQRGAFTRAA